MKECESETNYILYSAFLQQKRLFTVHKFALEDTTGLYILNMKFGETSNKHCYRAIGIKLHSECSAYKRTALITFFFKKYDATVCQNQRV